MIGDPTLLDIVDDSWREDKLPDDGIAQQLGSRAFLISSAACFSDGIPARNDTRSLIWPLHNDILMDK